MNHYMFPVGSNFKWKYNKWSSSLKISQPEFCAQKRGKKKTMVDGIAIRVWLADGLAVRV